LQAAALTLLLINKTFICVVLLTVSLESLCFIIAISLIISAKEVKWRGWGGGGEDGLWECKRIKREIFKTKYEYLSLQN
jgi:hypothetical protein